VSLNNCRPEDRWVFLRYYRNPDFSTVSLSPSSGPVLLATLTLDASSTSAGESFIVSLVPPTVSGSSGGGASTFFNVADSSFNELSAVPYTSTPGTVMITASAIPEPTSIVSGLTGLLILAGYHGVRRPRTLTGR
jgi:hypothetical protein